MEEEVLDTVVMDGNTITSITSILGDVIECNIETDGTWDPYVLWVVVDKNNNVSECAVGDRNDPTHVVNQNGESLYEEQLEETLVVEESEVIPMENKKANKPWWYWLFNRR